MLRKLFYIPSEVYYLIVSSFTAIIIIHFFSLDFYFADLIYKPSNNWDLREAWITSVLIHKYGKYSLILLYLFMLINFIFRNKKNDNGYFIFGIMVLLSSILLGSTVVGVLKQLFDVDCPWSLVQYGGENIYHSFWIQDLAKINKGHCFPAGHSSSAFTWISLYFYASVYYPKQRMKVLTTVLILGFIFGISQQLRGAHFLSHDIWSLLVCLFVNIGVYSYAYREKPQEVLV